jgi:hypothetical protein
VVSSAIRDYSLRVPLPETIPVKYTEEEAEYLSLRPVVRQTFAIRELVDMVLGVTGKDMHRIQQILRSGTVVYHAYRYWWTGFEAEGSELRSILSSFPDRDPARPFRIEDCAAVLFESGGHPPRHSVEVSRDAAGRKRLFRLRSFWDSLATLAHARTPDYLDYSYQRRADLYAMEVSPDELAALARDAQRLATRSLRGQLATLAATTRIVFVCPRPGESASRPTRC